ncbi:25887_t:CDS:2 [Dentiscutata erythropus]|uniref:25887_t:CDS:1 n=1 Tax=Dentiscutata erythropus TaxID=1348616 RepID=A0A9N9CDE8_9GLOM|nr:25887_t:CDS:2 [Dentiscutata erythropus]
MKVKERNPEACEVCRHRKRRCYEGIKGEKSCHYCTNSGKNCSYLFESIEHPIEAMGSSPSSSATQSTSNTNLLENRQSLNNILQLNYSDGSDILQGENQNPCPI